MSEVVSAGSETSPYGLRLISDGYDIVAHELRTPLTVIEAALDQPLLDRAEITQAARRLHRSIDNLLLAARIEAGEPEKTLVWFDPGELTRSSIDSIDHEGRQVRAIIPPGLPYVCLDPEIMGQAMRIAVTNAIIRTPVKGVVEVEVRQQNDLLIWLIVDGGSPLLAEEETKVFERFYRGGRHFTDGLLALWLVRQLVERHSGEVSARNATQSGVELRIQIPRGDPISASCRE